MDATLLLPAPAESASSKARRFFDPGLWLLLLFPLGLSVLDRNCLCSPATGIDTWVYAALQWNLSGLLQTFGDTYYATRLTAIIPGWMAHQLLPVEWAQYAVHLCVYWAGVSGLYLILRDVAGRRPAFLAALGMACSPYYFVATSWDYVDGFGIAYFLWSMYSLTRAVSGGRRRAWLLAGGVFAAAAVVANNTYVTYVPLLGVWFLVINRERNRIGLLSSAMYATLGGLGLLAGLGLFNLAMGGRFLFLLPSLTWAYRYNEHANNPNWLGYGSWMLLRPWLLWPAVGTASSAIAFVLHLRARKEERSSLPIFTLLALPVLQLAMFAVVDLWRHVGIVQTLCYVSMMHPTTFLALGGQLKKVTERLSLAAYARLCALVGVVLVTLLLLPARWSLGHLFDLENTSIGYLLLAVPALGVLAWVQVSRAAAVRNTALVSMVMALALVQQQKAKAWTLPQLVFSPSLQGRDARLGDRLDFYLAVREAAHHIWAHDRNANVWCWYNEDAQPTSRLFQCTASTQLFMFRLLDRKFPALPEDSSFAMRSIRENGKVVLFSSSPDAASAVEALRSRGLEASVKSTHQIRHPIDFHLTFFEVTSRSRQFAESPSKE